MAPKVIISLSPKAKKKTISLQRPPALPSKISMSIKRRGTDEGVKDAPAAQLIPAEARAPVTTEVPVATVVRAPKEVVVKEIPDFTKLVDLTSQWVLKQGEMTTQDRRQVLASLVKEVYAMDMAVKPTNTLSPLYRAVELPTSKLKLALESKYVSQPTDKFSSWTTKPATTHRYLERFRYGVVTSWNPIALAIVVDLGAMLDKIMKIEGAVEKLGGPKIKRKFDLLVAAVKLTQEVILCTPPPKTPVMGLVSTSKQFIRQLSHLNVRHMLNPEGTAVYVTLYDLQESMGELAL